MGRITSNYKFFDEWENTTEEDRKTLSDAKEVVRGRTINRIIAQALNDSSAIKSQIELTREELENEIADLERKIEEIEKKENLNPILEGTPDVSPELSIAAQKAEKERLERITEARNEAIKRDAQKIKRNLARKKELLQLSLQRVQELKESFEQGLPSFMEELCQAEKYQHIEESLINTLATGMASGYNSMESVGKDGEKVFNHDGDKLSTGYSINEEAARKFIEAVDKEAAVEIAASLARAQRKLKSCQERKKKLDAELEEAEKIDAFSEDDLLSVTENVRQVTESAQELISNSTAIANSGALSRFLSRIRKMFSIEGKDEKRNQELISQLRDIASKHMNECKNSPGYEKATEFYKDSLKTYRGSETFSKIKIGEERMQRSIRYFESSLLPENLEAIKSDETTLDVLRQLIEMSCLSENQEITDEAIKTPRVDYKHRQKEKPRLQEEEKLAGKAIEEAQLKCEAAQKNVDGSSEAKEVFENNSGNVIINWADKYLNMSARYGLHGPAALLALRAVMGLDDEEIIANLTQLNPEEMDAFIKKQEDEVTKFMGNFRKNVKSVADQGQSR